MTLWLTLLCVCAIAVGQLLFKLTARTLTGVPPEKLPLALLLNPYLWLALVIYAGATVGWVLLLRHADLHKIYPFMALSFILVPAFSWLFLGERFGMHYLLGIVFISIGILLAAK